MIPVTYVYVAILTVLGLVGYFATGRQSVTAFIPLFFGIVVVIAMSAVNRMAGQPALKWTLVVLAGIGFLATVSAVPSALKLMGGAEVARPAAVISKAVMAIVSLVYGAMILRQ